MDRQAWVNSSSDWSGRHEAGGELHLGDPAVVALQEAQQHVGEVIAGLAVEPAHDAEIDGADIALGIDEHVAGMLVAVEKAVAEGLLEEDRRGAGQHQIDVEAGGQHRHAIVHADAGQALQGQHTAGRAPPIDLRHAIGGIPGKVLRQLGGGGRLEPQIDLDPHHGAEGLDHRQRLEAAQPGLAAFHPFGDPEHQVDIAGEGLLDAGPEDLDRHRLALGGDGVMHLGDGGGRDGRLVEGEEQRLQGLAELRLEDGHRFLARKRRQAILEPGQILGHLLPQYVGTGGEELAELDEGRPQVDQGAGQALARPAALLLAGKEPGQQQDGGRQAGALDLLQERRQGAMAGQGARDGGEPGDVAAGAEQTASDAPGGVEGRDAAGEVAIARPLQPGGGHARRQLLLRRKAADALHQIDIGVPVARHDPPHPGQDAEGIEIVELLQQRQDHLAEFQAEETPAGPQHAARLGQGLVDLGDIAQPEGDGIGIDAAVGQRQGLGIPATQSIPAMIPRSMARSRPTSSMAGVRSQTTTRPPAPALARKRWAISPVPPATSRSTSPGRGSSQSIRSAFHRRWMPPDIRSFMRS